MNMNCHDSTLYKNGHDLTKLGIGHWTMDIEYWTLDIIRTTSQVTIIIIKVEKRQLLCSVCNQPRTKEIRRMTKKRDGGREVEEDEKEGEKEEEERRDEEEEEGEGRRKKEEGKVIDRGNCREKKFHLFRVFFFLLHFIQSSIV